MLLPCARLVRIMSPLYCPGATRGGRGVRYNRTIVNAHHVSLTCMQSPCARLVRILSPHYTTRLRRTLRSHGCKRASRKLSVHAVALCSPCAHYVPHYTAHVAGWTWYATSTASAAAASTATATMRSPAAFTRPGCRGVRYARTAHHVS
jgi:hypothetical protein